MQLVWFRYGVALIERWDEVWNIGRQKHVLFFPIEQFSNVLTHNSGTTHSYQIVEDSDSWKAQANTNAPDCVFMSDENICHRHATCVNIKILMTAWTSKWNPKILCDCDLNLTHGSIETGIRFFFWRGNAMFQKKTWRARYRLRNQKTAIKILHWVWKIFEGVLQSCLKNGGTVRWHIKHKKWTIRQIWGCHPDNQASGLFLSNHNNVLTTRSCSGFSSHFLCHAHIDSRVSSFNQLPC